MGLVLGDLSRMPDIIKSAITPNVRRFLASRQPLLWLASLVIGVAVGGGAILFRLGINATQLPWLGTMSESVASVARLVPWYFVLLAPAVGGLVVGLILTRFIRGGRPFAIADVIEARELGPRQIDIKEGLWSAVVSAISLGSGASAGREGPVVHLGSTLAVGAARLLRLQDAPERTLLACGVASAVAASFNAPIAGVLFAHEVILGHYALSAFVPIVIASAGGSILSRLWFGEDAAFIIPDYHVFSYLEVPAFALLGVACAVVAVLFQFTLMAGENLALRFTLPLWARPAVGGLVVGAIGVFFPDILGVGYETTDFALKDGLPLWLLLTLIPLKGIATSISLASRFGAGIFSPTLYLGALTGSAFGIVATGVFPDLSSSVGLYAILGMGAVAGAVLGAPISTTIIVFELTGGYALTLVLLFTVSIATGLTFALMGRSFFIWQLERRGLGFTNVPHRTLLRAIRVRDFFDRGETAATIEPETLCLRIDDTLEVALRRFDESGEETLPVVEPTDTTVVVGTASQLAALTIFNQKLVDRSAEEHR
jgi:CIC family chloride channel protein